MIARSIKAKALVFVIFFVGIGAGVLLANFYTTRVASAPDRTQRAQGDINKFYDYLGLNQDQRDQMHKIGEETRHEFQELRMETQPRFESIQEASRAKIRAVLNDGQRAKYDEFRKKMDERRRNRTRDSKNSKDSKDKNDRDPNPDRGPKP